MRRDKFLLEILSTSAVLLSLYSATKNEELKEVAPLIFVSAYVLASLFA